ncbi:MAG: hypothetical protein PHO41_01315 [Eubacteriales bacterium]|nr:hypothetical protein [Eubacteriales bacterium]
MKAIVYESNTGHTAAYAQLLSEKTGCPAYTQKEAAAKLEQNTPVLFMGWMMAGSVKGLKKAQKRYAIEGVCAVGMADDGGKQAKDVSERFALGNIPVFYLPGGLEISKLTGVYRLMMSTMSRTVAKQLSQKPDRTPEEDDVMELMQHGGSRVSEEHLKAVLDWAVR